MKQAIGSMSHALIFSSAVDVPPGGHVTCARREPRAAVNAEDDVLGLPRVQGRERRTIANHAGLVGLRAEAQLRVDADDASAQVAQRVLLVRGRQAVLRGGRLAWTNEVTKLVD